MEILLIGTGSGPGTRDPVAGGVTAPGGADAPPPGTTEAPDEEHGAARQPGAGPRDREQPPPGGASDVGR